MFEPKLEYSIQNWEKQTANNCVFYATARLLEKLIYLKKNKVVKFKGEDLVNIFRKELEDFDGGVNVTRFLYKLREEGYRGYKVRFERPKESVIALRKLLSDTPFLLNIKTYESSKKRVINGFYSTYPKGTKRKGSHLICVWGWDGENFLCLDSHYPDLVKMSEDALDQLMRYTYVLTLRT